MVPKSLCPLPLIRLIISALGRALDSMTKIEALWLGSMASKEEKLLPEKNFKWPENRVEALGVWISTDPSITLNLNYIEKADTIRSVLSCRNDRPSSPP